MNTHPYRQSDAEWSPEVIARARVYDEVAVGLKIANMRLAHDLIGTAGYEQVVTALRALLRAF